MVDIAVVIVYLLGVFLIGIYTARKVNSSKEYNNGGGKYNSFVILATLVSSFIGGGFTIGLAEKTFIYGIVFIFAIWGFSFKEYLIARFVAPRMNVFKNKAETVGDIMEIGFGKTAKICTGIASVLTCGGILAAQFLACKNMLVVILNMSDAMAIAIIALVTLVYPSIGGLRSVVAANTFSFLMIVIILPIIMFFGIDYVGGVDAMLTSLPNDHLQIFGTIGPASFMVIFLSFFLGETLVPPYMQRLLIGRTTDATYKGTLYSSIISLLLFAIVGIIGLIAYSINPSLNAFAALPFVIKTTMPIGLKGLGVAAMLAIAISTADSFLNASAIALKKDILCSFEWKFEQNSSKDLLISRLVTLTLGIAAITCSLFFKSTLDLLLYSYQFWTPFILTPLLAVIFGVRSNPKVFIYPAICGIVSLLIFDLYNFFDIGVDGALESVIMGILVNSIVFYMCLKRYPEKL